MPSHVPHSAPRPARNRSNVSSGHDLRSLQHADQLLVMVLATARTCATKSAMKMAIAMLALAEPKAVLPVMLGKSQPTVLPGKPPAACAGGVPLGGTAGHRSASLISRILPSNSCCTSALQRCAASMRNTRALHAIAQTLGTTATTCYKPPFASSAIRPCCRFTSTFDGARHSAVQSRSVLSIGWLAQWNDRKPEPVRSCLLRERSIACMSNYMLHSDAAAFGDAMLSCLGA